MYDQYMGTAQLTSNSEWGRSITQLTAKIGRQSEVAKDVVATFESNMKTLRERIAATYPYEGAVYAPLAPPTIDGLADKIAPRIVDQSYRTIQTLSLEYRQDMINLDLLEQGSGDSTALRRMQQFLVAHVYGHRVSLSRLPKRVRDGLSTGGRKRDQ